MGKVLVVCYSRGGTTLRLARELAEAVGAEVESIEESKGRQGRAGYVRSLVEAVTKGLPAIRTRKDPREYDLVVLGTPVWAGTMASPVRAYLFLHRQHLQTVAFFATMGGRGGESALGEMRLFCGADDAPTYVATDRELHTGSYRQRFDEFVSKVRQLAESAPASSQRSVA